MKLYGILCIIVAVILLTAPMAALPLGASVAGEEDSSGEEAVSENLSEDVFSGEGDIISVFMTEDKVKEDMTMREYIIGAVAAEMPASYNEEALKVQALAAVTFAEYMKLNPEGENIMGADISDDSSQHQGYMSLQEMKEKWGDTFDSYYEKIENAVDAVIDKVITYNGEPVMAAYHAISSGRTESALDIWGSDVPYLQSVESEGDTESTRYESKAVFTADEIKESFKDIEGVSFEGDGENWINIEKTSDSGAVLEITAGGKELTGMEVRNLLGLRSPDFTVSYEDGSFTFDVKGYGHGVGISQYGADYYAEQGMTYDEITKHYYTGVEIEERKQ